MDHPAPKLDRASFIRILFLDRYRAVRYRTLSVQNGHPLVQQGRVPDLDQGVMNVLAGAPIRVVLPVLLLVAQLRDERIKAICKIRRGRRRQFSASTLEGPGGRIAPASVAGRPETIRHNQGGRDNRNKKKRPSSPIPERTA